MRVIAGALKGRRLRAPDWPGLRPTSDRLKETVFNILAPRLEGARVLDGFAGTGALGIEALSRGAAEVTFIDSDRRAQALIADNLALCGIQNRYAILPMTMAAGIERLRTAASFAPFDIVLLDPPYATSPGAALHGADVVVSDMGVVVLEHARKVASPEHAGRLVRVRQVRSGDSTLSIYQVGS
jgi:16S rRNA (guanine(966)-N(2))-methyltransferase RsmD